MTTTALIASQSIGTGANVGDNLAAAKFTPAAISDRYFVECILTNGATSYDLNNRPRVWYAGYSASITAALAPAILRKAARYVEITPHVNAGLVAKKTSLLEPLDAPYVYVWIESPNLAVAQTLSVNIIEGP